MPWRAGRIGPLAKGPEKCKKKTYLDVFDREHELRRTGSHRAVIMKQGCFLQGKVLFMFHDVIHPELPGVM